MRKIFKVLTHRSITVSLLISIQMLLLIVVVMKFNAYFSSFYLVMVLISLIVVIKIVNSNLNPAYKLAWIAPILIFPIFGGLFYWLFGNHGFSRHDQNTKCRDELNVLSNTQLDFYDECNNSKSIQSAIMQSHYIHTHGFYPPYVNTSTIYYPNGESFFEALKEELRNAEKFIFMEYFIVQEGIMWTEILDILVQKANHGLDVRIIYDDIGSILTLPAKYHEKLEALLIKTAVFNPLLPKMSTSMNTRNHRKITVIDGKIGFTGGCNIADEYINAIDKHGHWKDSAIKIEGDAVWSLTEMFLSMWCLIKGKEETIREYIPERTSNCYKGVVQPFSDDPLDGENLGANIYINLINKAQDFIYIKSPYLIIDNEVTNALSLASKSGVDVRIITPGKGDNWYVHSTTRSYYERLINNGVKIYEYTPGFIHEKSIVVDDEFAVIGTINLDYRSFYLHFECGVWLYQTTSIKDMKNDFLELIEFCSEIDDVFINKTPYLQKRIREILRFLAPLM